MIRLSASVMAHRKRERFVIELTRRLDRPVPIAWDRRSDRWDTGRRAWLARDPSASHHLTIQDDALAPLDLLAGIERALRYVPDDAVVCLYAGRIRTFRAVMGRHMRRRDISWLRMPRVYWGVGIVVPTPMIDDMVMYGDQRTDVANYDRRISYWVVERGLSVYYPWPSLVDHRVSPSLIPGRGYRGRTAHRWIGEYRSALTQRYDGRVVDIPQPLVIPRVTVP